MGATRQPVFPRRVCRQCHQRKVKKAEHQFCSWACFRASRRPARPICPVCQLRPVSPQGRTCGRSCGAKTRTDAGRDKGLARMAEGRRLALRKRLAAQLHDEAVRLAASPSPVEMAKVLSRVYRKGYANGSSAAYFRYVGRVHADRRRSSEAP